MPPRERFIDKLWESEAESHWNPTGPGNSASPLEMLSKHLRSTLELIHRSFSQVNSSYAAIAGVKTGGEFTPLAAIGRELVIISPSSVHEKPGCTLISKCLHGEKLVQVIKEPHLDPCFRGDPAIRVKLLIRLMGYGELFGFISLDSTDQNAFDANTVAEFHQAHKALSRVLSDSVFTMRLWDLTFSFDHEVYDRKSIDDLYAAICDSTVKAFAACGAILRKYDPESGRLNHVGTSGDVSQALLQPDSVGERITRLVYEDPNFNWTIGMIKDDQDPFFSGVAIPKDIEEALQNDGIMAYCVFRLESEPHAMNGDPPFGTLSLFHRHPHHFSWRDIALARSLVRRSTDLITLFRKQTLLEAEQSQLQDLTEELKLANEILETESQMTTRAEIVTLLAHDLGHKSFAALNSFETFQNAVRKAMSNKPPQPFNSVTTEANEAMESIRLVIQGLNNVNTIFNKEKQGEENRARIVLYEAVTDVVKTLENALSRNTMSTDINIPGNIIVIGNKTVLAQVMFNLLINSVHAQRFRRNPRKNTVHIHAEVERSRRREQVLIKFWDEGPGINQGAFNDVNDIFKLGITTKDEGTGRGLPISRNLLNTYFNGELWLKDPKTALFHLVIPSKE